MKQQVIRLVGNVQYQHAGRCLDDMPLDSTVEVVFRNAQVSKTMAQLGALFGLWFDEIQEQRGIDKDEIHKTMKAKFLCRIYATNPMNDRQQEWSELLIKYQEEHDYDGVSRQGARVSLSWITKEQMKSYMTDVYAYWVNNGTPLSVPDKFHKYWRVA